jgi:ribosomal protein L37AE/L43A
VNKPQIWQECSRSHYSLTLAHSGGQCIMRRYHGHRHRHPVTGRGSCYYSSQSLRLPLPTAESSYQYRTLALLMLPACDMLHFKHSGSAAWHCMACINSIATPSTSLSHLSSAQVRSARERERERKKERSRILNDVELK